MIKVTWRYGVIAPPVRIRQPEPVQQLAGPVEADCHRSHDFHMWPVCVEYVCVFRGELAEDSADPLSVTRRSEETHPTQTVQVTFIIIITFIITTCWDS